ncbi:hypothetical protein [Flexithrix dorotheae]|uniref:hypothetical protein n=1 Tax=Flexithrix dorotheae TaxID=70993 RepID=UPI000366A0ED|nr:hypothetical protein [Flexithrix dorotheae]
MKFKTTIMCLGICCLFFLTSVKCSSDKVQEKIQDVEWIHINEKDDGTLKYFQKEKAGMSPGRRESVIFMENGNFEWKKPGPNDRRIIHEGDWQLLNKNEITLEFDDNSLKKIPVKIVSFKGDTLLLQYEF